MSLNHQIFQSISMLESPDATWKPFRSRPIVLARGKGSFVWDVEGKRYIDLIAGFGALPLGHQHESFISTLRLIQRDEILVQGLGDVHAHFSKERLFEKMREMLPSRLSRVSLAVTGSQAVETAIKSALLATKGQVILAFKRAYHGLDFGSLEVTERDFFRDPFKSWLTHEKVRHLDFGLDLHHIEKIMEELGPRLAGVLVEPIQGRGGNYPASLEWLTGLAALAKKSSVPLILDEVMTGFGRSGRVTYADIIDADIVCFGKALGGGMPLSACVGTESVMSAWPVNHSEAIHTGTFFGHPMSCLVGEKTLDVIQQEELVQRAKKVGSELKDFMMAHLGTSTWVKDIRGEGLLLAVEFISDGLGVRAMEDLQSEGFLSIPCGERGEALSFTPALNIPTSDLEQSILTLKDILERWN